MKRNRIKGCAILAALLTAQLILSMDRLADPTPTEAILTDNQAEQKSCCINSKYHCISTLLRYICIPCIGLKNTFKKLHNSCCNCCIKICGEDEDSIIAQNS